MAEGLNAYQGSAPVERMRVSIGLLMPHLLSVFVFQSARTIGLQKFVIG